MRIAASLVCLLLGTVALRQDPATAPPVRLKLLVDGQEYALVEGVEAEVAIADKRSKVRVVLEPQRHFQAAGIEFDFPREMAFDYDESDPPSWTLDGNDVVVHVYAAAGENPSIMLRTTVAAMVAALDESPQPAVPQEWTLGGKPYKGLRATMHVGIATIQVLAVGFEVAGNAVVLMVQDTLEDDGSQSDECKQVLQMVERSFKFTAK